uniref:Arginine vasopressin receptor 2, like n=1 Tax=Oryzias latipes TaxID=8090 RepID=A0A3P9IQI1_ORYLA
MEGSLNENAADSAEEERFTHIRAGVLGLVFVLATCSNALFLAVLWRKRKRNSRTKMFLVNLCSADLAVAFFQVLPQFSSEITRSFRGTDLLCRSVKCLQVVGMFASAYIIVVMAIDRYQAVCTPMVAFLEGSCHGYARIGGAWLTSFLRGAPQLFIFSLREVEAKRFDCWATFMELWGSRVYISWITLAVFVLPAVLLLYCQMRIGTTIYFNMKRKALQSGRACSRGVSNTMLKTVKMAFVIIMAHTLCWSPFFVVQLWSAWSPSSPPTQSPVFATLMLLASLNSYTNPWIYLYYS